MFGFRSNKNSDIDVRKSEVRIFVTIWAAVYVFGGSALLIAALWIEALNKEDYQIAKDIFMTVLPIAAGIITYWFASRPKSPEAPPLTKGPDKEWGNEDKSKDKISDNNSKIGVHKSEV